MIEIHGLAQDAVGIRALYADIGENLKSTPPRTTDLSPAFARHEVILGEGPEFDPWAGISAEPRIFDVFVRRGSAVAHIPAAKTATGWRWTGPHATPLSTRFGRAWRRIEANWGVDPKSVEVRSLYVAATHSRLLALRTADKLVNVAYPLDTLSHAAMGDGGSGGVKWTEVQGFITKQVRDLRGRDARLD